MKSFRLICFLLFMSLLIPRFAQGAAPELSSANDGVRRGSVLQIYGENLAGAKIYQWMPPMAPAPQYEGRAGVSDWRRNAADTSLLGKPPAPPAPPAQKRNTRRIFSSTAQCISMESETGLPQFGAAFFVWAENADGISKPLLVNRPRLWWLEKDEAAPGETLRIFGRNLTMAHHATGTIALKNRANGKVTVLEPRGDIPMGQGAEERHAYEYRQQLRVPADAPAGEYDIYIHNGSGAEWGWSQPLPLKVRPAPAPLTASVRAADFGARGDGLTDDTAAVEKAVAASAAIPGGAWVQFSPGVYSLTRTIALPPGVGLIGSGMDNTVLQAHTFLPFRKEPPSFFQQEFKDPGMQGWAIGYRHSTYTSLFLAGSGCRLHDLTLDPNGSTEWTVMAMDAGGTLNGFEVYRVRFRPGATHSHGFYEANALRRGGQAGVTFLSPSRNVSVTYCDFIGASVRAFRGPSIRWHVAFNTYSGVPNNIGSGGPSAPLGMRESVVEHNRASYGSRGLVMHDGACHNFVFNNVVEQTRGDGGGEPYLLEGGGSTWYGRATGGRADGVSVQGAAWTPGEMQGQVVLIVKGRGLGQYRFVADNGAETISVTEPWRVVPDETTVFGVGYYHTENILFANSDVRCNMSHYYGNSVANVWSFQRSFQSLGFSFAGNERGGNFLAPVYYNDLVDSSFRGMRGMVALRGNNVLPNRFDIPVLLGNRIARCDVEGGPVVLWERWWTEKSVPWARWQTGTDAGWRDTMALKDGEWKRPEAAPGVSANIVENCLVTYPEGPDVLITEGCRDNIVRGNRIFDRSDPARLEGAVAGNSY